MAHLSLVPPAAAIELQCRSAIALEVTTLGPVEVEFGEDRFVLPVGTELEVDCRAAVATTDERVGLVHGFASWECPRCGAMNHVDLREES